MPRPTAASKQPEIVRRFLALTTPIGAVEAKPMFGGYGFYFEGMIFALEAYGRIWLKADRETHAHFAKAGCERFVYDGKTRPVEMPYWTLPKEAEHGGAALRRWVDLSLAAARRSARSRRSSTRRWPPQEPDFI